MTDATRRDPAEISAREAASGVAHDPRPALEILGVDWERVQLVVRARWVDGVAAPGPDALRLRQLVAREPDVVLGAMPPTGWRAEGEGFRLRFNVMAGPDQMPMALGQWRLELRGGAVPVVGGPFDPIAATGRFALARGEYVAAPSVDPADGTFRLDVDLTPTDPASAPRRATVRRTRPIRLVVSRLRRGIFRGAYRIARRVARRTGRRILFASDSRADLGGNLRVVWDRMIERGLDQQ